MVRDGRCLLPTGVAVEEVAAEDAPAREPLECRRYQGSSDAESGGVATMIVGGKLRVLRLVKLDLNYSKKMSGKTM